MQDSTSEHAGRLARVRAFLLAEHCYVFLGTSVLAACGLWLANQAHSPLSFLNYARALELVLYYVLVAWLAASALALVSKLTHWKGDAYVRTSPFARPAARRAERYLSYVMWAVVLVFVADRVVMGCIYTVQWGMAQTTNPSDFLGSTVYMLHNMGSTFVQGIVNTVIIALVGTIVAFFLALVLVFLRLQEQDDWVAAWSDQTIVKLRQVLTRILVENGYLDSIRAERLNPVLISPVLERAIRASGQEIALPAFNCLQ